MLKIGNTLNVFNAFIYVKSRIQSFAYFIFMPLEHLSSSPLMFVIDHMVVSITITSCQITDVCITKYKRLYIYEAYRQTSGIKYSELNARMSMLNGAVTS